MATTEQLLQILLADIEPLSHMDRPEFSKLQFDFIEAVTRQGTPNGAAFIDGTHWIPKSQLRFDVNAKLWIPNWLYNKVW